MAIGIVSTEDFDLELEKLTGQKRAPLAEVVDINRGRGNNPEVPGALRAIIGEEAIENGNSSGKEMARAFGISDSSVSAYKAGATSTASYDNPDKDLKNHVDEARGRIAKIARTKLLSSLKHITKDKLEAAKLRDVAAVATAMSSVIRNMENPEDANKGNNVSFVFMAPREKKESDYEVIQVDE